ncbi:hypothetical protein MTO96_017879 [Rhipicephalus appendiculatus]
MDGAALSLANCVSLRMRDKSRPISLCPDRYLATTHSFLQALWCAPLPDAPHGPKILVAKNYVVFQSFQPWPASSPGVAVPGPSQLGLPHVRRTYSEHILHPALAMLMPRPGEHWLASVFHRGFIPRERLRLRDQLCNERTICEEGTCCLEIPGKSRLCKPTATRGERCTLRALINVYIGHCFCGYNQGTCEDGYCT